MSTHPGYPTGYLDVFKCRELGRCWHDQKNDADGELEGYPICPACQDKSTVEVMA